MTCVCGLAPDTEQCCGRFIRGDDTPATAEALMRSRYAAYVLGEIDYIVSSHHPERRDDVDAAGARSWSEQAQWEGLDVHRAEGGEDDDEGVVDFTARYMSSGHLVHHRERAQFKKHDGKWYFFDSEMLRGKPVVREGRKVGRNEPCPCGSGKKYKKCCGR